MAISKKRKKSNYDLKLSIIRNVRVKYKINKSIGTISNIKSHSGRSLGTKSSSGSSKNMETKNIDGFDEFDPFKKNKNKG